MKNTFGAVWRFPWPETWELWRRYSTHHGKTTTSNIRNTDFNRTYSNWTFPNRILDRYLRWSECPHTYCLTPHKPWTIHHHTWRHLTLWTLLFTHRSWRLRKLHMNYSWHWSMLPHFPRNMNQDRHWYVLCTRTTILQRRNYTSIVAIIELVHNVNIVSIPKKDILHCERQKFRLFLSHFGKQ